MNNSEPTKPIRQTGNDLMRASNRIDQLGLGEDVERMARNGLSHQEIGQRIGEDPQLVNRWLVRQRNMSEEQRQGTAQRSIFNITANLEDSFTRLYGLLDELNCSGKTQDQVMVIAEIRQHMRFAAEVIEKLHLMQQFEQLRDVILELLEDEAPGIRAKAVRRLAENKDYFSILKPL